MKYDNNKNRQPSTPNGKRTQSKGRWILISNSGEIWDKKRVGMCLVSNAMVTDRHYSEIRWIEQVYILHKVLIWMSRSQ